MTGGDGEVSRRRPAHPTARHPPEQLSRPLRRAYDRRQPTTKLHPRPIRTFRTLGRRDRCRRLHCDIGSPCGDPRAVIDRPAAAQNDNLEGACSTRTTAASSRCIAFQGIDQVRANWSALLGDPDFARLLDRRLTAARSSSRSADGNQGGRYPLDERGVLVMGISDDRIAWGRLVRGRSRARGAAIDAVAAWRAPTKPAQDAAAAHARHPRRSSATCSSNHKAQPAGYLGAAPRSRAGRGYAVQLPLDVERRGTRGQDSGQLASEENGPTKPYV